MQFAVNPSGEVPIFRQIIRQMTEAIAGGRLKRGEQLPSHRELSERLVIAPLTVKRAYDELEAQGYIETQRGRGTFVCAELPAQNRRAQREELARVARRMLSDAYLAGLRWADVVKILEEADRDLKEKKW